MNDRPNDRRRDRRRRTIGEHGIVSARIRPGHRAVLINVSVGGALVETGHRLLPGSFVELHVETTRRTTSIRGRVLRSAVVQVRPAAVCYRGAIAFDRQLPWLAEGESDGHAVPTGEMRPGRGPRVDTTQDVL